jgi:hypothetical protein
VRDLIYVALQQTFLINRSGVSENVFFCNFVTLSGLYIHTLDMHAIIEDLNPLLQI